MDLKKGTLTTIIKNVWLFKYLGARFRADGNQLADITARIAAALKASGQMRNIWAAKTTPTKLKMRIYKSGVCSRLVYGCEAWILDAKTCATLNGANSRMVARITGRTVKEEASRATRTFDVVRWKRARRLLWVGHILRMKNDDDPEEDPRMVYKAAEFIYENRQPGDLLMDIPRHKDWDDLRRQAKDRKRWRSLVRDLRNGAPAARINVIITGDLPKAKPRPKVAPKPPKAPLSKIKKAAKRRRVRDAHNALFHPTDKRFKTARPKIKSKKKKARVTLTTTQRQQAARAQWFETHDREFIPLPLRPPQQPPRDIYANWPPNFDKPKAQTLPTSPPLPSPLPPTPTSTPTITTQQHNDKMQQLRLQRRGRFRKKRKPKPQTPTTTSTISNTTPITTTNNNKSQHTTPATLVTPVPPTITPAKSSAHKRITFSTPTNEIYSRNQRRLSLELRDQANLSHPLVTVTPTLPTNQKDKE